ncbi:hypothetical protein J4447_00980 [Candidatus Pacearchaeota archaeon]|nr:hypothetical protein [Candidatus Pacearchaeota archaeon]
MQFKIITNQVLRECLSNLLMNNYSKSYEDFRKFVKLEISEERFEEFKKREITKEELAEIIEKTSIDTEGVVERVKNIWNGKEKEIVDTMNNITCIGIDINEITCYVDPYQNGGYYGEDNIMVGVYENPEDELFVIAHELFHVFYWRRLAELSITKSVMGKEEFYEWQLAEAVVHLLTTDERMRKFWRNIKIDPYPEIKGILTEIGKIWKEKPFDEFLKQIYKLYKR